MDSLCSDITAETGGEDANWRDVVPWLMLRWSQNSRSASRVLLCMFILQEFIFEQEQECKEEDSQTDKAICLDKAVVPDKPVGPVPGIESIKRRIPSMTPKVTSTLTAAPKVTNKVDVPTVMTSKRSHS